eukprot:SAG11_NODE_3188_length_2623_cov_11.721078_2_plen_59_part_00
MQVPIRASPDNCFVCSRKLVRGFAHLQKLQVLYRTEYCTGTNDYTVNIPEASTKVFSD